MAPQNQKLVWEAKAVYFNVCQYNKKTIQNMSNSVTIFQLLSSYSMKEYIIKKKLEYCNHLI